MRIWSSNTTHHEYNLHRVVTTLSIKLKCVNTLELKIKPWPVESHDLMNQTGAVEGATGELELPASPLQGREQCVREQGVGAAACDRGGISGWWLHEWSLAVTAAHGWRNPSGQHVFSTLGELNTDRRLHLAYIYTHSEHSEKSQHTLFQWISHSSEI